MKKYEFTGETKVLDLWSGPVTLHRIRAVRDFGDVKAGGLGGWIEKEENLDHDGNAWICDDAQVWGDAQVYDDAWVCDDARVWGDARVCKTTHVLTIGPIGSRNDYTTFFRDKDNEITVKCGCFVGKLGAFLDKVAATHGDNKHAKAYRAAVELARAQIDLDDIKEANSND